MSTIYKEIFAKAEYLIQMQVPSAYKFEPDADSHVMGTPRHTAEE
jgi:hypothetical protein